jgi:outer membrane receptor protein involved in Fe transport
LLRSVCLAAVSSLALTSAAFAQDTAASPGTTTPEQTEQATADPTASQAQPAAVEELGANDIVVTATRRSETVQNVPIAITAVNAELLRDAGVADVRDLEQLAPSLQTSTGQSAATGTSIFIRGIGTAGDNPGFEPAVGVFVDGVFRSRAGVALSELPELERVEVLRGPQGTLFGRNTSAGALSVFTAKPQYEFKGFVEGVYGNLDARELRGAVTGPVTEQLALRLDGGIRKRDGYIRDINSDREINSINRWFARGQALFENGTTSVRVIGDYARTNELCCGAVSVARGALAPVIQGVAAAQGLVGLYTGAPSDRIQAVSPNREFRERVRDWGASVEVNHELGADLNLTSITAYRDWRARRNQDIDFSGIDRAYRDNYRTGLKDFTQELRLQGTLFEDRLDFLVGGFYLNERLTLTDTVRVGNDANRYVDSIFAGALAPTFGRPLQFFGSLGPTVPLFGQALLGAPAAAFPAQLRPLVQLFQAQAGVAPIAGIPVIPGLAALATSPLTPAVAGQGNNNDEFRVKTNAFALFTHNILKVTDELSLTLGLRWNHEEKTLTSSINNNLGSCGFFNQVRAGDPAANAYANVLRQLGVFNNLFLLGCNPAVNTEFNGNYRDKRTENEFTGTAKVSYKFSDRLLAYGSYDRGYKSGGYNLDQATFDSVLLGGNGAQGSDLEFGAEKVDSFEIGIKSSPTRQFTFNLAAFYAKYKNLQNLVFSGNNFVVQNIADSTSKGVEAEAIMRPDPDLTVRLAYTYNLARYDRSNDFTGTPLAGAEGRQFTNQPKSVVTGSVTWNPAITDQVCGIFHVDTRFQSEVDIFGLQPNGRAVIRNPAYAIVNALVGAQTEDGRFRGEFFVENLTGQYFNVTGFAVPEQTGNFAGYPNEPRTYGVRLRVGF